MTHFFAISKQFLSRIHWKILHLTDLFTQPAVVMVVTNMKYVCWSDLLGICWADLVDNCYICLIFVYQICSIFVHYICSMFVDQIYLVFVDQICSIVLDQICLISFDQICSIFTNQICSLFVDQIGGSIVINFVGQLSNPLYHLPSAFSSKSSISDRRKAPEDVKQIIITW